METEKGNSIQKHTIQFQYCVRGVAIHRHLAKTDSVLYAVNVFCSFSQLSCQLDIKLPKSIFPLNSIVVTYFFLFVGQIKCRHFETTLKMTQTFSMSLENCIYGMFAIVFPSLPFLMLDTFVVVINDGTGFIQRYTLSIAKQTLTIQVTLCVCE